MIKSVFTLLIIIASVADAQTTSKDYASLNSGILYGEGYCFGITAPKGWVFDDSSGNSSGKLAEFYPVGGTWDSSPAVMYITEAPKDGEGKGSLTRFIADDIEASKQDAPDVKIGDLDSLKTNGGKTVPVKLFEYSQYEAVAYVDGDSTVVMLVLSSTERGALNDSMPAFKELVGSYLPLSSNIQLRK